MGNNFGKSPSRGVDRNGPDRLHYIERLLVAMSERQLRIERKLNHILGHQHEQMEGDQMDRAQIDRLITSTAANTDATKSATAALTAYATSSAELTDKLRVAVEAAGADATAEVTAAMDAIDANNKMLMDSVPKVAAAVVANTPAAT